MHPRNLHKNGYDFAVLSSTYPKLRPFLLKNPAGDTSINFSDPMAVKTLNAALLAHYYGVKKWDIPDDHLCPPVPGRADYIHYIADLISGIEVNSIGTHEVSFNSSLVGLDIGVGANLIYPILGSQIYKWHFVGSEVNKNSFNSANKIIQQNQQLSKLISLRRQTDANSIFAGIIGPEDKFDFSMCNPPFHTSQKLAEQGSQRKNRNLARNKLKRHHVKESEFSDSNKLNFAGKSNELWCDGGEVAFIKRMAIDSQNYATQVNWFTSLVSKKVNLNAIYRTLEQIKVEEVKTVNMGQGNKISRFVAWRFIHPPNKNSQR